MKSVCSAGAAGRGGPVDRGRAADRALAPAGGRCRTGRRSGGQRAWRQQGKVDPVEPADGGREL